MISNAFSTSFVRGNKSIRIVIVAIGLSKFKRTHGCSCAFPELTKMTLTNTPKAPAGALIKIRNVQEPARASVVDLDLVFLRGWVTIHLQTLYPINHKKAVIQALAMLRPIIIETASSVVLKSEG